MKKYFQAPWKIKDLLIALTISAILMAGSQILLHYLGFQDRFEQSETKTLYTVASFLIQWIIFFIPLLFIGKGLRKVGWQGLGFKKYKILPAILLIVKGFLLYLAISVFIALVIIYYNVKIPGYQIQSGIFQYFDDNLLSLVVAAFITVLMAPVLEEIFFRGFILRTLTDRIGKIYGSVAAAGLFAVSHMTWQSIIPIFILGLIINSLVIKSKSLWPAIGFHIINNAIAFTVQLLLAKEIITVESLV